MGGSPYGARAFGPAGRAAEGSLRDMSNDDREPSSSDDFDRRLREARETAADGGWKSGRDQGRGSAQGIGLAFRIGLEMVAGTGVGAAIGWGLDVWLETLPLFLIIFLFLGTASGVMNAYRAAKGLQDTVGFGKAMRDKQTSWRGQEKEKGENGGQSR